MSLIKKVFHTSDKPEASPEQLNAENLKLKKEAEELRQNLNINRSNTIVKNSTSFVLETLFLVIALGSIIVIFFMDKMMPFDIIRQMRAIPEVYENLGIRRIDDLEWGIRVLFIVIAILSLVIARVMGSSRKKNNKLVSAQNFLQKLNKEIH